MKTGVLTAQCGRIRSQALAFVTGHSAMTRSERGEAAERAFLMDMVFSEGFASAPRSMVAAMLQRTCDRKWLKLTWSLADQECIFSFQPRNTPFIFPIITLA